ncbi:MAG TPA: TAXI family TRAP transporter solute-binding subunit, partial [Verrucomicrobiae bacterium]|nr:TAXI family TRAP transporter solute-binding subunit [Verrucomicrobiae bacterium]
TFGLTRAAAIGVVLFVSAVLIAGIFWFIHSAPPRVLIITSGPPGSSFERIAGNYRALLSSNGVTLKILLSEGSLENLERLENPKFRVDVGFVQTGESAGVEGSKLLSLGSVAYQPLLIFYRSPTPANLLSELAGKRLAIGAAGSGTRALALTLLQTNGIVPGGATTLLELEAEDAAKALLEEKVDAVFLMGDSASSQTMRKLLHAPGIRMFDFAQADAYTRRFGYLNKLQIPRGAIDFASDIPPHDVNLIGPTVELVARSRLHPALCDLLLEAAHEVHGKATLLQRRDEFPAPLEHEFKISPEAARYYKSGKKFLYASLPFWLASLVNRIVVAFVPMVLVLIPGLRFIPVAYKWRTQLRIYRWYRSLLRVERDLVGEMTGGKREELQRRLNHIESSVNQMKVPASFAGQFYGLRQHIAFVRDRLKEN